MTDKLESADKAIVQWLTGLPKTLPLKAVKVPAQKQALTALVANARCKPDPIAIAMLWLRLGEIDRAHSIVQDDKSAIGSYLHGIVHRLEGDYWNSSYWLKQVRDTQLLNRVSLNLGQSLVSPEHRRLVQKWGLLASGAFHPISITKAVESLLDRPEPEWEDVDFLEYVGFLEWDALWQQEPF